MEKFDYGIIGGGPAGYTSAIILAKQGFKIVLFEKDDLGGTCLNKGCIPTKSFLHSAEIFENFKKAEQFGIKIDNSEFDFAKVIEKKNYTVEKIRKSLELLIKNLGIYVVKAEAKIKDKHTITANNEQYLVEKIILATGSKPRESLMASLY